MMLPKIFPLCRRFCSNEDLFKKLVQGAIEVEHHREALGGNAPVMANRFAIEGSSLPQIDNLDHIQG